MNLKLTTSVDMNTYYMPTKMKYKSSGVMSLLQRICTFLQKNKKSTCISAAYLLILDTLWLRDRLSNWVLKEG
jgi:hypothetical protein